MREFRLDLTEEIATWSIQQLIKLFVFLETNGFTKIYFDGNNAIIYATKSNND